MLSRSSAGCRAGYATCQFPVHPGVLAGEDIRAPPTPGQVCYQPDGIASVGTIPALLQAHSFPPSPCRAGSGRGHSLSFQGRVGEGSPGTWYLTPDTETRDTESLPFLHYNIDYLIDKTTKMTHPDHISQFSPLSSDQLTSALDRLGVRILTNSTDTDPAESLDPVALIAGLAGSSVARLRQALIPLLLWRPDLANDAAQVDPLLEDRPRIFLHCYYTAAMLLQMRYRSRLRAIGAGAEILPDLFSSRIGLLVTGDPDQHLENLAERQAQLTGENINWLGTYHHAASSFIKHLEWEIAWSR